MPTGSETYARESYARETYARRTYWLALGSSVVLSSHKLPSLLAHCVWARGRHIPK